MNCPECGAKERSTVVPGVWACECPPHGPSKPPKPLPKASIVKNGKVINMKEPLNQNQRFWLILWIGLASIISATILAVVYLTRH